MLLNFDAIAPTIAPHRPKKYLVIIKIFNLRTSFGNLVFNFNVLRNKRRIIKYALFTNKCNFLYNLYLMGVLNILNK